MARVLACVLLCEVKTRDGRLCRPSAPGFRFFRLVTRRWSQYRIQAGSGSGRGQKPSCRRGSGCRLVQSWRPF